MSKHKHYTIPVFIPFAGCEFQCVFCDQNKITSILKSPSTDEIGNIIESCLATIPRGDTSIEIGFFGGTFTALPSALQEKYLKSAQKYLTSGNVDGIRLSTRPDKIGRPVLDLLKKYHVSTIELGAQSMNDDVLRLAGRGHTAADTVNASGLILQRGFRLGLQLMPGLTGDRREYCIDAARQAVSIGASDARIYPAVVIDGTPLADDYRAGKYAPLTMEDAVEWTADMTEILEAGGVHIIKIGLHASEDLTAGTSVLAGPFHPQFREMVYTGLWRRRFAGIEGDKTRGITLHVPDGEINYAAGFGGTNRKWLEERFRTVRFAADQSLGGREFHADID
ncbi:MAG: radical SAM protein [Brevinematales bacterium]|nr:radical SAM protein [Brevinematales bacterium]